MKNGGLGLKDMDNNVLTTDSKNLLCHKILSAVFYGVASFMIVVINKIVLTTYKFPSSQFVGIGQMVVTIIVLFSGKKLGIIQFPELTRDVPRKIWPLPLFYLGNLVSGLGGTRELSLPMFAVLRRFSILMTMIAEYYILGVISPTAVKISVGAMVGGAVIATSDDLSFDLVGYIYVLANNVFTAANGVYVKKKLDSKDLGKYGILYYCSLFMIIPAVLIAWSTNDLEKAYNYPDWRDAGFLFQFFLSCVMGFVLMYSSMLCTLYNSALTTTIVGCLKNIIVTYLGMFIGGDYIFSMVNFIGLNISVIGSIAYTGITFSEKKVERNVETKAQEKLLQNV